MQVVLALASIHTVQVPIVNYIFDMCVYPKVADKIRDEIRTLYLGKTDRMVLFKLASVATRESSLRVPELPEI